MRIRQPFGLSPDAMASLDLNDDGDKKDMMEIQYLASILGLYVMTQAEADELARYNGAGQGSPTG